MWPFKKKEREAIRGAIALLLDLKYEYHFEYGYASEVKEDIISTLPGSNINVIYNGYDQELKVDSPGLLENEIIDLNDSEIEAFEYLLVYKKGHKDFYRETRLQNEILEKVERRLS